MKKSIFFIIVLVLIFIISFIYQKKTSSVLKIGFVTDFEYKTKNNSENSTQRLLSEAVAHYNYLFKPDVVIGGGDYVDKKNNAWDNFKAIDSIFQKIKARKSYCLGKKDISYKNNFPNPYFSEIFKGIKIIVLDTTENNSSETAIGTIEKKQLDWLKTELNQKEPSLIFMHHSSIETPDKDNWKKNLTNQEEVYKILKENNKKIIAIFSGNSKQDYITKKSGIPFINISGLTNITTLGRFSDIKIAFNKNNSEKIELNIKNYGRNNSEYEIKRDLEISTSTRISLIDKNIDYSKQNWFDVSSSNNSDESVLNSGLGAEPSINTTVKGNPVVAFENKEKNSKIQVKIFKDGKWQNLSDENHPDGLISLGRGSNPNIETKNEDIFVIFTETDYEDRIRLLQWQEEKQQWQELSKQGFISEKSGHEPTLIFDNSKENLYIAFAQKTKENNNQTLGIIKTWDGKEWKTVTSSLLAFAYSKHSSVDEFDLASSKKDNSIYITYEEKGIEEKSKVRVKKWNGEKWNNLSIDKLYYEQISKINGYSPSIAIDGNENLYLAFVENNDGPTHVYKHNGENWEILKKIDSKQKTIEPFIEVDSDNNLYLAFSEYKENIVMIKNNGKNTGEELIKTNAWRVRVQKYSENEWQDLEDSFNYDGFISKGSGKGDPALKTFENTLYIVFSDEENNYAVKVKKYTN